MIFAKYPTILVNYKLRKGWKKTNPFKVDDVILESQKIESEMHMHKCPHWHAVDAKPTEDLQPPTHPQCTSH